MPNVGIFASGHVAASSPIAATFQQSDIDTATLSTYTFSAQPIGAASATRRVVVGVSRRLPRAINSATIGGVSATIDADASASNNRVSLISAVVPTGTTATVTITLQSNADRCGIGVWTLDGGSPTGAAGDASGDPANMSVTTIAGDVVISCAMINGTGSSFTWSDADERYDQNIETDIYHTGADTTAVGILTEPSVDVTPNSTNMVATSAGYR